MFVEVYTDGSHSKDGKKNYCGYGVHFTDKTIYKNLARKFNHSPLTNNRPELYSIVKALTICNIIHKKKKITQLCIKSDSEYCVNTVNKWYSSWVKSGKDYKNKDIVDDMMWLIKNAQFNVTISHVRAHKGIKGNEIADILAKLGSGNPKFSHLKHDLEKYLS